MQPAFHQERVAAVADRYRQRGYQVVEEPRVEQLPDFLKEFKPDLLAKNSAESVVIEVQSSGQVARSRKLEKLAKSVENQPGWRLELILSNAPSPLVNELSVDASKKPTISLLEIEALIVNSKQLASAGNLPAAVILLWSAVEAALRTGLEQIPASFVHNVPSAIIKQGVAYGLLDPQDADILSRLLPIRNAVAHGFSETIEEDLLDKATRITKNVVEEVKRPE